MRTDVGAAVYPPIGRERAWERGLSRIETIASTVGEANSKIVSSSFQNLERKLLVDRQTTKPMLMGFILIAHSGAQ